MDKELDPAIDDLDTYDSVYDLAAALGVRVTFLPSFVNDVSARDHFGTNTVTVHGEPLYVQARVAHALTHIVADNGAGVRERSYAANYCANEQEAVIRTSEHLLSHLANTTDSKIILRALSRH